ncbi:hypothetical protein BDV3_006690 [Batrachochytrium dendrobatidis]|uniref:Mediator of DNA damage checkpoint protein 1 n=1 Tax=Batrachochytrium dendrobatidis (strain JEL423) TaxID=403673 RepID=A0A177WR16_BATDL|nr:hypothetical protein BDEG_26008 [Batrachochytrium dendrobatidis JEL423]
MLGIGQQQSPLIQKQKLLLQEKQEYVHERIKTDISSTAKRTIAYLRRIPNEDEIDSKQSFDQQNQLLIPVKTGINLVGATRESVTICLDTPGVSGLHAVIEVSLDGAEHFVQDLDSTNGTSLGITQYSLFPNKLYQLAHNKIISFGPFRCRYEMVAPKECMQHIDYSLNPIAHESDMEKLAVVQSESDASLADIPLGDTHISSDLISKSQDIFYDPANDPNIAKTASIHDPQSFNNSNPFLISPATESKFHINKEDDEHSSSQTTEEICMSVHQDTENHYIDGTKPIQMEESEMEESKEYSLSQDICISSMPLSPSILSPPLIDEETQFTLGQRALHNISEEQGDHDQFPHEAVVSLQIQDPSPLVLDTCSLNTSEPAVASNNLSHTKTDSTASVSGLNDTMESATCTSKTFKTVKENIMSLPQPAEDVGNVAVTKAKSKRGRKSKAVAVAVSEVEIEPVSKSDASKPSVTNSRPQRSKRSLSKVETNPLEVQADSKVEDQYELDLFAFPEELPKKPLQSRKAIKLQPDSESIVDIDNVGQFFDTEAPSTTSSKKSRSTRKSALHKVSPCSKRSSLSIVLTTPVKNKLLLDEEAIVSSNSLGKNSKRSLKEPSGTLSVDDTITKDQVEKPLKPTKKAKHDQTKLSSILDPVSMNDSAEMRDCSNKSPEQQVRVLFTGIPENDERREIVDILGGTIVSTWSECTHLVTDRIRRTVKFLCAVSAGKHIMDVKWLEASKKEGEFAGEAKYILKDIKMEKLYKFTLKKTLAVVRKRGNDQLFSGKNVFSTSSVKPGHDELREILDAAGGSLVTDIDEVVSSTIAIADLQDISECERLREIGVDLYTTEVVLTGILRQELDLSSPQSAH